MPAAKGDTEMNLPVRAVVGFSAALGTMAFVLTAALITPQAAPTAHASAECPNALKAKASTSVEAGA